MSFGILNTLFSRLEKSETARLLREPGGVYLSLEKGEALRLRETEIPAAERPPMMEIPEYREKFKRPG
jgi:glucosyl-3-phosphoglycerate synthase